MLFNPFRLLLFLLLLPTGCSQKAAPAISTPLGAARTLEPGISEREVTLGRGDGTLQVWIYLPQTRGRAKLPCVFVAPAGSRLFHGMGLADGDRKEQLPYVRAGFAVVAYEIEGPLSDSPTNGEFGEAMRAFRDADAGLADARAAIDYALAHVPEIDPRRLYTAGHSSAGTLSLQVAEHDPRIAACVAYAPCCDVPARLGAETLQTLDAAEPGFGAFLTDRSPNAHPADLRCPLFLFHADDDSNVPTAEVAAFSDAVRRTNSHVTFVRVPTGDHYQSMIDQGIPHAIHWLLALPPPRP